jgi:hypothetical protein
VLTKLLNVTLKPSRETRLEARTGTVRAVTFQPRDVELALKVRKENGNSGSVCYRKVSSMMKGINQRRLILYTVVCNDIVRDITRSIGGNAIGHGGGTR